MIFLTMGTGMGGGVIAEGKLLIGASDMAGEIGHLRLSEGGPVGFGKAGSFEGWCSGGGIARYSVQKTREWIQQGKTPVWIQDGHAESEITAALIAEYAFQDDEAAKQIYAEVGRRLGKGLALLTDAFNPEKIVIGSIYARSHALLEEGMLETLRQEAIPYSLEALEILPAKLGEQLGDCAAVMTALYGLGEDLDDACSGPPEEDERVLRHFERLLERCPALEPLMYDDGSIMQAYSMLRSCFEKGGKLLLCGNGGSAADCEHIVGELMKGFYFKRPIAKEGVLSHLQGALPAIALSQHTALSTAFGNDCDSEYIFAQQLFGYGRRGDVLLAISTSGNSSNVLRAVEVAREIGVKTVALTGGDGGKLKELCDVSIVAPARTPADVQEYHLPIYHTLCAMLEAHFYTE